MRFTKMQGCGNDYIYINCFEEQVNHPENLAIAMSERHFGVGSDGLVLIMPSDKADFRMRMFNLDGSEGNMCGNAVRCIGKYVYDRGLTQKTIINLETKSGIKVLDMTVENGAVQSVTVDMGEPILESAKIPVEYPEETAMALRLDLEKYGEMIFTCVSMGNPHAVTFVDEVKNYPVHEVGQLVELHKLFPDRTNVEFIEMVSPTFMRMRVWERGSGETLACGTGACGSAVAAILNGRAERKVAVDLIGGTLEIFWNPEDNHVYMTGPAAFSFDGVWLYPVD